MLKTGNLLANLSSIQYPMTFSTRVAAPTIFQQGMAARAKYLTSFGNEQILWELLPSSGNRVKLRAGFTNILCIRDISNRAWRAAESNNTLVKLVEYNQKTYVPQFGKIIEVDSQVLEQKFTADFYIEVEGVIDDKTSLGVQIIPLKITLDGPYVIKPQIREVVETEPIAMGFFLPVRDADFALALGISHTVLGQSGSGKTFLLRDLIAALDAKRISHFFKRKVKSKTVLVLADEPNLSPLLLPQSTDEIYKYKRLHLKSLQSIIQHIHQAAIAERGQDDYLICLNIITDSISQLLYEPVVDDEGERTKTTSMSGGIDSSIRGTLLDISYMSGIDANNQVIMTGISTMNIPGTADERSQKSYVTQVSGAETAYIHVDNQQVQSSRNRLKDVLEQLSNPKMKHLREAVEALGDLGSITSTFETGSTDVPELDEYTKGTKKYLESLQKMGTKNKNFNFRIGG